MGSLTAQQLGASPFAAAGGDGFGWVNPHPTSPFPPPAPPGVLSLSNHSAARRPPKPKPSEQLPAQIRALQLLCSAYRRVADMSPPNRSLGSKQDFQEAMRNRLLKVLGNAPMGASLATAIFSGESAPMPAANFTNSNGAIALRFIKCADGPLARCHHSRAATLADCIHARALAPPLSTGTSCSASRRGSCSSNWRATA